MMKSFTKKILAWPCLIVGFVALSLTAGAQTQIVTGWGVEGDASGGSAVQLIDDGLGDFTIVTNGTGTGLESGNLEMRALLATPVTLTNIGDTITLSGTMTFTNGNIGGQVLRVFIGSTNGNNVGTLSNGKWSTANETNWLGYIVDYGAGGTPTVAGRAGGTLKDWDSTSGDYYTLGGQNSKQTGSVVLPSAPSAPAGTYYMTLSAELASSNFIVVSYSLTNAAGTYADIYTITNPGVLYDDGDLSAGVGLGRAQTVSTTTFNAVGFFQNASLGGGVPPFGYSNIVVSYYNVANASNSGYTNVIVDNFTAAGIGANHYSAGKIDNVWTNFGLASSSWAGNSWSSTGPPGSTNGSLVISANWANGTQFWVWNAASGGISPAIPGLAQGDFSCDVQFGPSSPTTTNNNTGIYGHLQVGTIISNNFVIFSNYYPNSAGISGVDVPASDTGWYHINVPINAFDYPYETTISNIAFKIDGTWYTPNLTSGTTTLSVANVKFISLIGNVTNVPVVLPPTIDSISAAPLGVRIFANSSSKYVRQELGSEDENESWYNGSFPVSYSFTVANAPALSAGMQMQIWLVPLNGATAADNSNPYNDDDIDSTSTNVMALVINNSLSTNNNYGETLLYKVGAPGVSLNPGSASPVVNLATNYSTTLTNTAASGDGTWSLVFTSNTGGYITGPGLSPASFTMSPTDAAQFNGPLVAYFGIQPNGSGAIGNHIDILGITIVNGGNSISDNFAAGTGLGNWSPVPANTANGIWDVPPGSAYWINWSYPAIGYDLEVSTSLFNPGSDWVNPAYYNGYSPLLTETLEGGVSTWTLVPASDLPGTPNGYFKLADPANFP